MFGPTTSFTTQIEDIGAKEMLVLVPIALIIIITGVMPNCLLELSAALVK
jgi:NADH-quinone oxidoreductase subunit M